MRYDHAELTAIPAMTETMLAAILVIGALMLLAKWIRRRWKLLQRLFLPSSIIAGVLALLLGPQVLGRLVPNERMPDGLWNQDLLELWSGMPGLLINVVFAALFLGKSISPPGEIWRKAGPMVAHGQTLAWGQYVVGLTLVILILTPLTGVNPMAGALIEIGFEGGHGTAAGLGDTFRELGFANGADLALGMATVGVVGGVILGTLLINWAVWRGHIQRPDRVGEAEAEQMSSPENLEREKPEQRMKDQSIEPLSIHLGFIAVAIGLGWLLLKALVLAERHLLLPLGWPELMEHIPLFPLAMIGGVIVQLIGLKAGYAALIDRELINRIGGVALDLLIVAALATLSLAVLGDNLWVLLSLVVAGVAWNLFGFLVLARLMFPRDWVANGLANFGQGMGMTVIGLLLVRMVDPRGRTGAMEAFGYKQLLFEPVVGGGLFTAASLPLIYQFGPVSVLIGTATVMLAWLIFGLWQFGNFRR